MVVPHSQPTASQQTVCTFHLDLQYNIFHWGSTVLGVSTLCSREIPAKFIFDLTYGFARVKWITWNKGKRFVVVLVSWLLSFAICILLHWHASVYKRQNHILISTYMQSATKLLPLRNYDTQVINLTHHSYPHGYHLCLPNLKIWLPGPMSFRQNHECVWLPSCCIEWNHYYLNELQYLEGGTPVVPDKWYIKT